MKKAKILLVDDQKEILDSLGAILIDEGHEVIMASDGQEAIHIVQSDSPDVVFLDIWIPGLDGMQTLKAVKKIDPDCAVIMMSGHGTIETAVKAIQLGAMDYLEKPLNLEDVLHLVEKAATTNKKRVIEKSSILSTSDLIGNSKEVQNLRKKLANIAHDKQNVLLIGDKGTGKEFIARIIHASNGKDRNTLAKIRCNDITQENLDELLAPLAGNRTGKIHQSLGGSLLLVRIDRLKKELRQPFFKLLQKHLSEIRDAIARPRIISTTATDSQYLMKIEEFEPEFLEFLSGWVVKVPGLKERADDIPLLIHHFMHEASEELDKNVTDINPEVMERLSNYSWPGNIKELKLLIEHIVMTAAGPEIQLNDLLMPWGNLQESGSSDVKSPSAKIISSDPINPGASQNRLFQKTLRSRIVVYGQGLHSGNKTGLTLSPLPASTGILFGHITSSGNIPATLDNVESTGYSTTLRHNGSPARTIEHLMAVFHVYGLTNVLAKISGEVPIMDGSALEFCNLVESAEIIIQEEPIEEIIITETNGAPAEYRHGKIHASRNPVMPWKWNTSWIIPSP